MGVVQKIADRLISASYRYRTWINTQALRNRCTAAPDVGFGPKAVIWNASGRDAISIGRGSFIWGQLLTMAPAGRIIIGEWCSISPDAQIWAKSEVKLGNRVIISHGAQIFDNNSHSLSALERHERFRDLRTIGRHQQYETVSERPVVIGDDAWIGFNAAVLKGVKVGRGAVVGGSSVITQDVPDYAIMVGNPARQVGTAQP